MTHPTLDELGTYVDGELAASRADDVAAHVRSCVTCYKEVEWQRQLRTHLDTLPREIGRPGDGWAEISARLSASAAHATSARFPITRMHLIAASVLVAVSVGATAAIMRGTRAQAAAATAGVEWPEPASPWALVAGAPSDMDLTRVQREIDVLVDEERHTLRPETFAAVERNLRIIDAAIRDVRRALAADPGSSALRATLFRTFEQKAALLRQTAQAS